MSKHFKLILPDEGFDIYMPRDTQTWGYRYGPSIMCHDGIAEAWFASPGDAFEADWFTYRRSDDGGKTWSYEKVVMAPTPDSMDWFSVCDPAVIKYGEYYYIGYTSTLFANGGGVCNNGFVGRSKSPTGPFEKWTKNGWGEHRTVGDKTYNWIGNPAPILYFDEDWHKWGTGELSMVVKGDTLYIYSTWTTAKTDGSFYSVTNVATADITREDWPATIKPQGVASKRSSGKNDSYDVVYCEDIDKFIALSTDLRFTNDSILAVYESEDGLRFTRVNEIKVNTSFMCHNCGISGDCLHHIKSGDMMFLAYAYGNQWGKWGTRMHRYDFTVMEEEFYSERDKENIAREIKLWPREETLDNTYISMVKPHFMQLHVGEKQEAKFTFFNVCYERTPVTDVNFSNYDDTIISIDENNIVTGLKEGYTYIDVTKDGHFCQALIYVRPEGFIFNDPNKKLVSFEPTQETYNPTISGKELKQIRAMAKYTDGSWKEICEPDENIIFVNHNPDIISVTENGLIYPKDIAEVATVTVKSENFEFDVKVIITE